MSILRTADTFPIVASLPPKNSYFFIFASPVRRLHVRESRTVLDSGFYDCGIHIPGTGFQYLSVELGFWNPVVSGIPDSLSCIPVSKTQDSTSKANDDSATTLNGDEI